MDYRTGDVMMAPPIPYGEYAKDYAGAVHGAAGMTFGAVHGLVGKVKGLCSKCGGALCGSCGGKGLFHGKSCGDCGGDGCGSCGSGLAAASAASRPSRRGDGRRPIRGRRPRTSA